MHKTKSFKLSASHQILLSDQVKKTEMGRACGTYGAWERCMLGFGGET